MSTNTPNVRDLLQGSLDAGAISRSTFKMLTDVDMTAKINAGLGTPVDAVAASEVLLVTDEVDDSGSIRMGSNAQIMRDATNEFFEGLRESKQADAMLGAIWYLNGTILVPYVPLGKLPALDAHNYNPTGGTPLYDVTVELLGTVIAKCQAFADAGVVARSITLIATDGADCGSVRCSPADCRDIVTKMLAAEQHIVAAMGIDDGVTDFRQVFREMGIPDEWILTPKNTRSEIRKALNLVSQSAIRASQNAAAFSATASGGVGGFGSP